MEHDDSRRFTDREVAMILRRAVEIDELRESVGDGGGEGLALTQMREIGREVGISAEAIERAAAEIGHRRRSSPRLLGTPLSRKVVHAVPTRLDPDAMARLVRIVDERSDSTGTISEALGSVRWTASDRFKSSLVSITPDDAETRIQVVEKFRPKIRRIAHLLPPAYAVMFTLPFLGSLGIGAGAALAVGAGLAGAALGRGAWEALSAGSRRRVERLAAALAAEAGEGRDTAGA